MHAWRTFLFKGPAAAPGLLPERWPGTAAASFFDQHAARLRPAADRYVEHCLDAGNRIRPTRRPLTVTEPLLVDRTDAVVTLTLNRPEALNSLDVALKEALRDPSPSWRPTGPAARWCSPARAAFSAGQDLREHVQTLESGHDDPLDTVRAHYNPIAARLANLPKPVVAAVRGMAAGAGASLAFLADFRIGGPKTSFLMAFAKVGLAADTGASWTLPGWSAAPRPSSC